MLKVRLFLAYFGKYPSMMIDQEIAVLFVRYAQNMGRNSRFYARVFYKGLTFLYKSAIMHHGDREPVSVSALYRRKSKII